MGSLRRGLILALLPAPAWAQVCEELRPGWDGTPISAWSEALSLFTSPAALILLAGSLIAVRYKSQWGTLAACVGWSALVSVFAFWDGGRTDAMAEGCIGSPMIFILAAATLCVAMVLYIGVPAKTED